MMKAAVLSLVWCLLDTPLSAKPSATPSSPKLLTVITVSGMVDIAGEQKRIEGIQIAVKGTHHRTQTNSKGQYKLTHVPTDAVLVYSYKGANTQEYAVQGQTRIVVVLGLETANLPK